MAMWASVCGQVLAQSDKPAVVVSVSSIDEMMADLTWVGQASGSPQAAQLPALVSLFTASYTRFMDTSKPSGVLISMNAAGTPTYTGFVPVKDLQGLLGTLAM